MREIKLAILISLVFSITALTLSYFLKSMGIYHGSPFIFLLKSLSFLALLFLLVTPSVLNKMRLDKKDNGNMLKLDAIPAEAKFCNNCKFATLTNENKYKCSEGSIKGLVDKDYCCVFWEPNPIVWDKLLKLRLK